MKKHADYAEYFYDGSAVSADELIDVFGAIGTNNYELGLSITLPRGTKILKWYRTGDVELIFPDQKGK